MPFPTLLDRFRRIRTRPSTPSPSPDAAVLYPYPLLHAAARTTPRRPIHPALAIKVEGADPHDVPPSPVHQSPPQISPVTQSVQESNANPSVSSPTVSEISSSPDPRPRRDPTRTVHFAPKDVDPVSLASLPTDPALLRRHLLRLLSDRSECLRLITAFTETSPINSATDSSPPSSSTDKPAQLPPHHVRTASQDDLFDALDPTVSLPARLERALHTVTADLSNLRRELSDARSTRDTLKTRLDAVRAVRETEQCCVREVSDSVIVVGSKRSGENIRRTMTIGPVRGDCVQLRQECDALRIAATTAYAAQRRAENERDAARALLAGTLDDKKSLVARVDTLTGVLEAHADDARKTEDLLQKQKAAYEGALKETRGVIKKLRGEAGELQQRVEVWKGEVRDRDHRHGLVVEELRKRGEELAQRVREFRDDWEYAPEDGGEFGGEIEVESVDLSEEDFLDDVVAVEDESVSCAGETLSESCGGSSKGERSRVREKYITLLCPLRPLGPTRGVIGSGFVTADPQKENVGLRFSNIRDAAFVEAKDGFVQMACDLVVSGELSDGGDGGSWTFVHARYTDSSSLTYLPIGDLIVTTEKSNQREFGGFSFVHGTNVGCVRISIAEDVYEEIVLRGLYALIAKFGSIEDVVLPEVDVVEGRQMVDVSMMPTCSVEWSGGGDNAKQISDLLSDGSISHPDGLRGKALVALAFRSKAGETRLAMELVGLCMERR